MGHNQFTAVTTAADPQPTSLSPEPIPAAITTTETDKQLLLTARITAMAEVQALPKNQLASVFQAILATK